MYLFKARNAKLRVQKTLIYVRFLGMIGYIEKISFNILNVRKNIFARCVHIRVITNNVTYNKYYI